MQRRWIILGLITLAVVISLFLGADPEHAQRLDQMRRDAAFTGESRELVLLLLAIGIGGFIAYLTLSRRGP
jgi:lipopolysaccharide export system protein LptC